MSPERAKSFQILDCRIDGVSWQDIDAFCREALNQTAPKQIVTINGEFVLEAQTNQEFKSVINNADLVVPDSTNVVWVSRLKGFPVKQVTPGSDLTIRLAGLAAEAGRSVYLLGGWRGVPAKAAAVLTKRFPNLTVAGWSEADPQDFDPSEIKKSGADVVFVAYAAPNQDIWISRHKDQTGAKLLIGVGGTFNMLAGTLPRAPKLFRALHLEWLWRFLLEPHRRFKRVWKAVVVFPLRALFS